MTAACVLVVSAGVNSGFHYHVETLAHLLCAQLSVYRRRSDLAGALRRQGGSLSVSLGDSTPRALGPTRVRAFVIWVLAELLFGAHVEVRPAR